MRPVWSGAQGAHAGQQLGIGCTSAPRAAFGFDAGRATPATTDAPPQNGPVAAGAATSAAPVPRAAAVSATVAAAGPAEAAADGESGRRSRRPAQPQAKSHRPRRKVSWYWRLLAWIVAVPVGFVITVWPAYELGFIKKDDVLDIFVGTGAGRYVRLAIVTIVWALVTALLVQLFVEGGRAWAARRRARAVPA